MSLESKYNIPKELGVILNELIESAITNNPKDLTQFCCDHFTNKLTPVLYFLINYLKKLG